MNVDIQLKTSRVKPAQPRAAIGWDVWRRGGWLQRGKFGFVDYRVPIGTPVSELGTQIREATKAEFGGRWYGAAAWGTVLRFSEPTKDILPLFDDIDTRTRLDGSGLLLRLTTTLPPLGCTRGTTDTFTRSSKRL